MVGRVDVAAPDDRLRVVLEERVEVVAAARGEARAVPLVGDVVGAADRVVHEHEDRLLRLRGGDRRETRLEPVGRVARTPPLDATVGIPDDYGAGRRRLVLLELARSPGSP